MRATVVGSGFGTSHLAWLNACQDVRITVLGYRHDRRRAQLAAARYNIPRITSDPKELLEFSDTDLVVIASPPGTHEAIALAAMERGLAVMCEKPLAATLDQSVRMADAARRHGIRAAVTFQWREHAAFKDLRAELGDDRFGELLFADLSFHHDFLAAGTTEWPWRHSRATAGAGALADLGVHLFDLLCWLTGSGWSVRSAQAQVAWPERRAAGGMIACETDDVAFVELSSGASAAAARILVSRVSPGHRELRVTAVGTRSVVGVVADPADGSARVLRSGAAACGESVIPPQDMNPYPGLIADIQQGTVTGPGFPDGVTAQSLVSQSLAAADARA